MNCNDDIFRKALEDGLKEHGFYYQHGAANIYFIVSNYKPDRITIAKLIGYEPIDERKHGSKKTLKLKQSGTSDLNYHLKVLSPTFTSSPSATIRRTRLNLNSMY